MKIANYVKIAIYIKLVVKKKNCQAYGTLPSVSSLPECVVAGSHLACSETARKVIQYL